MANLKQECINLRHLLGECGKSKALLQEALDKSAELVASLEAKVELLQTEVADTRRWWGQEKDTVKRLKDELIERNDQSSRIVDLINHRDALQRRLDQCLGWIAKSQNKGPFETCEPDAGYPFNNGSR